MPTIPLGRRRFGANNRCNPTKNPALLKFGNGFRKLRCLDSYPRRPKKSATSRRAVHLPQHQTATTESLWSQRWLMQMTRCSPICQANPAATKNKSSQLLIDDRNILKQAVIVDFHGKAVSDTHRSKITFASGPQVWEFNSKTQDRCGNISPSLFAK